MKRDTIHVLLAERETLSRQCIRKEIEGSPSLMVEDVGDGQTAVERAVNQNTDVVLLNTNLPKLDGYQAAKAISARNQDAKIILTTNYINEDALKRARESGAHGFLLRDVTATDLTNIINDVSNGRDFESPYYRSFRKREKSSWDRVKIAKVLTKREYEILHYLGFSNRDIASHCQLSECTVKQHVKNILNKLGAHNRTEAAIIAMESGLSLHRY